MAIAKKILIVDDDIELCEELGEILQDEGFSVNCFFDGVEGKKNIEKFDYDLLILDFKMPGLNGVEILRELKQKNPLCKFFMISGKPHLEKTLKEENLFYLLDGVMQKPFDIEALIQKVHTCLS